MSAFFTNSLSSKTGASKSSTSSVDRSLARYYFKDIYLTKVSVHWEKLEYQMKEYLRGGQDSKRGKGRSQ